MDISKQTNQLLGGITLRNETTVKGTICLWNFSQNNTIAEVGYDLSPKYHKKGIMTEALKLIIDYGFKELKLDNIKAFKHTENESSKKLLERNGFLPVENGKDKGNDNSVIFELENAKS